MTLRVEKVARLNRGVKEEDEDEEEDAGSIVSTFIDAFV